MKTTSLRQAGGDAGTVVTDSLTTAAVTAGQVRDPQGTEMRARATRSTKRALMGCGLAGHTLIGAKWSLSCRFCRSCGSTVLVLESPWCDARSVLCAVQSGAVCCARGCVLLYWRAASGVVSCEKRRTGAERGGCCAAGAPRRFRAPPWRAALCCLCLGPSP